MKKVVIKYSDEIIDVEKASKDKYYGVIISTMHNETMGFIMKSDYGQGSYCAIALDGMTFGNSWSHTKASSLSGCIKIMLDHGDDVFEFESFKEMSEWMNAKKL